MLLSLVLLPAHLALVLLLSLDSESANRTTKLAARLNLTAVNSSYELICDMLQCLSEFHGWKVSHFLVLAPLNTLSLGSLRELRYIFFKTNAFNNNK